MKIEVALIRHGQARKDGENKLIGMTDEPLAEEGKRLVLERKEAGAYPNVPLVFSSGLRRCMETSQIIYSDVPVVVTKEIRAPDYGCFEGMSYTDIGNDESFGLWVSNDNVKLSLGCEEPYAVRARSATAFRKICDEAAGKGLEQVSIITHKIVIQAILQRYFVPRSNYVYWEVPLGGGYLLKYDTISADIEIKREI